MNTAEKNVAAPTRTPLPLIGLVRKTPYAEDEPPNTRLLERGPSWMESRPRLFMVATAVSLPDESIISIMRMNRHQVSINSYQHESVLRRAIWDIQDAGYTFLDNGGGGFISDDPASKTISVICKSVMGRADQDTVIQILKTGLKESYHGYKIIVNSPACSFGEVYYEEKPEVAVTID